MISTRDGGPPRARNIVMFSRRRSKDNAPASKRHRSGPERHLVMAVVVSFGLTMLSYVASRVITEIVSRRVQHQAQSIDKNAIAATEALVTARTTLHKMILEINDLRISD